MSIVSRFVLCADFPGSDIMFLEKKICFHASWQVGKGVSFFYVRDCSLIISRGRGWCLVYEKAQQKTYPPSKFEFLKTSPPKYVVYKKKKKIKTHGAPFFRAPATPPSTYLEIYEKLCRRIHRAFKLRARLQCREGHAPPEKF